MWRKMNWLLSRCLFVSFRLVQYILFSKYHQIYLLYWLAVLAITLYFVGSKGIQFPFPVIIKRKYFHILGIVLFAPIYVIDVSMKFGCFSFFFSRYLQKFGHRGNFWPLAWAWP
jgi:hypothetical protein